MRRYQSRFLDKKEKELKNKKTSLVKIIWRNHAIEEATWENEDEMGEKYLELF